MCSCWLCERKKLTFRTMNVFKARYANSTNVGIDLATSLTQKYRLHHRCTLTVCATNNYYLCGPCFNFFRRVFSLIFRLGSGSPDWRLLTEQKDGSLQCQYIFMLLNSWWEPSVKLMFRPVFSDCALMKKRCAIIRSARRDSFKHEFVLFTFYWRARSTVPGF